jgi:hypothetical protein
MQRMRYLICAVAAAFLLTTGAASAGVTPNMLCGPDCGGGGRIGPWSCPPNVGFPC